MDAQRTIILKYCVYVYLLMNVLFTFFLFGKYPEVRAGILIGVGNILILFKYKENFCEFRFIAKIFS